ncbi:MAG: hypothetical protein HYW49_09005 [Deltaproteobacteria bacterium]|nr:hypothetical protein [Deltaproteobacteria bacterium]
MSRIGGVMRFVVIFATAFAAARNAHALKFSNQFVEFELPNMKWNCALEGAEWVCQSTDEQKKRDAIVVLAAKLKGEQDSLDKYQEYLNKARAFTGPGGKAMSSQPKYAKAAELNGQPWIDSLHLESEIPGFYTRYLATVKQDIGVLVTYSINKVKYQDYLGEFEGMVKSLKVFRKAGGVNTNTAQSIFQQGQLPGSFTAQNVFPDQQAPPAADKPKKAAKQEDNTILFLIVIGAAVAYFIWKRKRGKS